MKKVLAHFAKRFIAGETRAEALQVARGLNEKGIKTTIDLLGENTRNKEQADNSVKEYSALLADIENSKTDSTISLKLTHMGLDITDTVAEAHLRKVVEKAKEYGNFVRIDMESSAYTERTLEIFHRVRKDHDNVGVAVQTCLRRSEADVKRLIEAEANVRLVKGAYNEPDDIAFEDKTDVDATFLILMRQLIQKGNRVAIATHDLRLIDEAKRLARNEGIAKEKLEIQMLLGIKEEEQEKLAKQGYKIRTYIPYGPEWLPYILRRLTERKENLYFVLKNYFG
jgi:proline dehydrogenase